MLKKEKVRKQRKIYRVRKSIFGTSERPRLSVSRSLNHIYAQLIDDSQNVTLAAASTRSGEIVDDLKKAKSKTEKAQIVGSLLAKKASEKEIKSAVFDRGGYSYHGRVKALADGARKEGLVI
jgi:large subunit ribosomal protein L18